MVIEGLTPATESRPCSPVHLSDPSPALRPEVGPQRTKRARPRRDGLASMRWLSQRRSGLLGSVFFARLLGGSLLGRSLLRGGLLGGSLLGGLLGRSLLRCGLLGGGLLGRSLLGRSFFASFFSPLTTFFRSAPALNAGTVVFFTLTVSPVRGLRAVRAPRTRASNLPKPVMTTDSPMASERWTASSTASSDSAAAARLVSSACRRARRSVQPCSQLPLRNVEPGPVPGG